MLSRLFAILALGLGAIAMAGCDRGATKAAQPQETSAAVKPMSRLDRSRAGTALPAVTVTDPTGAELALPDLAGTPVLLNLWATWCAPCVTEMPLLDDLAGDYGKDLQVVTVSQDLQGAAAVEPFFATRDLPRLPQWLDPDNELAFGFGGGAALPLTVLFDSNGEEVWRYYGDRDWASAESRALVEEGL